MLFRSVREEVGLRRAALGPCVWTREHEFVFRDVRYHQRERFFLARCESFEVDDSGLDAVEAEVLIGHRWWTVDEIRASGAVFAPRRLGELLQPLLDGILPDAPIAVGI